MQSVFDFIGGAWLMPEPRSSMMTFLRCWSRGVLGHEIPHGQLIEIERAVDDVALDLVEGAGAQALLHQPAHLVLGDGRVGPGLHAEQPQQHLGGFAEKGDERRGEHRKPVHEFRHAERDAFGIAQADALGHQLADDERKVGDGDYDQAE